MPGVRSIQDQYLEKPLPSSEESERVILGAIILDNGLMAQAIESLDPADFYTPRNRTIYGAMLSLFEKSETIDPITIGEELKRGGQLDSLGGVAAITNLTYGLPHFSDILHYTKIVREKAITRNLIRVCNQIVGEALSEEEDAKIVLDNAEQAIFSLAEARSREGFVHIREVTDSVLEKVREFAERKNHALTGLASGFVDLDRMTSGFQPTDLIIVAARPSMGKTALCLNIAQNVGIQEKGVVGFFSLEMSRQQLVMRMLSSESMVESDRLRRGNLLTEDWQKVAEAVQKLADAKIFIDDTPGISVLEMRAKCRRLLAEQKKLDLIVIDYMQLMSGTGRSESRQQEVSKISRELKGLAKELNVPVIALSQLSRAPEARNPPRPIMSDLRESGSIEQDADVVAFIYREDYYNKTDDNENIAELLIAKQRNGPTGDITLSFLKNYTRFDNYFGPSIHGANNEE